MKIEARFCSECGAQLEEGTFFCGECGAKVTEAKKQQKNEPPTTETEHKHNEASTKNSSSNNSGLWLILGIVILIIIGGTYIFIEQQNQSTYVKLDKNEAPDTNYFAATSLATPETDAGPITLLGETYDPSSSFNDSRIAEKKACDNGDAIACSKLGSMYKEGKGVKKDILNALIYYQISCDISDYYCGMLGSIYEKGQGVKQDIFKALKYYKKACDSGNQDGCKNYRILNYSKKNH